MTEKRFTLKYPHWTHVLCDTVEDEEYYLRLLEKREDVVNLLNQLNDENEWLKKELKRCRDWINSDQNDYELTLAFIKNKGYSLKDVIEYEKELKE